MKNVLKDPVLRDPIVWGNLLLRLILVALAIGTGRWYSGDTHYYLDSVDQVSRGLWGGDAFRPSGYAWFIYLFSFGGIPLALLAQTFLVWLAGLFLYKRTSRLAAGLWLFDPGMLIYSNIVMTDAIFTVSVLMTCLYLLEALQAAFNPQINPQPGSTSRATRALLKMALFLAVAILFRTVGIPIAGITFMILGLLILRKRLKLKPVLVSAVLVVALITPRLYWTHERTHQWSIAIQGMSWIPSVAGIVEYHGQGLTFLQAEEKWFHEHPDWTTAMGYQTIAKYWKNWSYLTAKGIARILIGHVNVEWAYLFTGKTPLGPGWFKEGAPDGNPDRVSSGLGIVLWALGIITVAGFCLWVYVITLRSVWHKIVKTGSPAARIFCAWALLNALLILLVPQVYGDSRFRTPLWALLVVCLGLTQSPQSSLESPREKK